MTVSARLVQAAGVSALALMAAQPLHAQSSNPPQGSPAAAQGTSTQVGEVIITAQRRKENLQKVPLAVSAFTAEQLSANQIVSTVDLARQVPNMFASNNVGQGSANVYYIRGLGQTQSFPTFEPQVSTYVDDIYIARQNANNFALFGVSDVEVLRGPQGTLFGRNSTGGAILVTLAKPADTYGGDLSASYGSWNQFTINGSADIPINDQIHTRTSAFFIHDDGYVNDVTTHQTLNYTHDWGVREAVRITPKNLAHVTWDLSADYENNNNANLLNFIGGPGVNGANRISYSGLSTQGGALAGPNPLDPAAPLLTGDKPHLGQGALVQSWGFASHLKYDTGVGTLSFITGFRGLSQSLAADFPDSALGPAVPYDTVPTGQFALAQELRSSQYSQEIKWDSNIGDRFRYTAGLFYLYESNRNNFGAVANLGPLFGTTDFPFTLGDETERNDTASTAVYAQGDYKVTDKLTLTVGGRYTHEQKKLWITPNTPAGFTTADVQAAGWLTRLSTDQFTPRVAVQYQFSPDLMVFGSATRGFQGGGWNGLAFNAATYNDFGPETVWSYETGFRAQTPDHRFTANVTAFYEDVKKYQLLSDNVQAASFVTTNAANLRAFGAEGDFRWNPVDPLTIGLHIGLMDAKYYHPAANIIAQQQACAANPGPANAACGSGIVNGSGGLAPPTYAPPVTANLNGSYRFRIGDQFILTPTVGVDFTAREAVGTEGLPASFDKARTLLDMGVTFAPENARWSITGECRNCTMVDYGTTYLFGYRYYNIPGSWDVRLSYKF